ncbi:unnamed protein product, partial [Choristocarpus tenellus]
MGPVIIPATAEESNCSDSSVSAPFQGETRVPSATTVSTDRKLHIIEPEPDLDAPTKVCQLGKLACRIANKSQDVTGVELPAMEVEAKWTG